jgi:hypothetical protein
VPSSEPVTIAIVDDPHRPRGLRSKPFDGEGVATRPSRPIDGGRFTQWLLNSASARQLGLETNGHATRGIGGSPGVGATNVHLEPGTASPAELMADVKRGLYVTELIGQGVNSVTGDYSRGASGFLIEDGEITTPVAEITIAGNLLDNAWKWCRGRVRVAARRDQVVKRMWTGLKTLVDKNKVHWVAGRGRRPRAGAAGKLGEDFRRSLQRTPRTGMAVLRWIYRGYRCRSASPSATVNCNRAINSWLKKRWRSFVGCSTASMRLRSSST